MAAANAQAAANAFSYPDFSNIAGLNLLGSAVQTGAASASLDVHFG